MRKFLLFLLTHFIIISAFAQQEPSSFSEALATHLPKYKLRADKAYRQQNIERADFLFDSLVKYGLKGSKMDNFKLKNLKNKEVALEEFSKPVYLTTNASWIVPTKGEIPALNALAAKYGDQVDFVLLFWDDHSTTKSLAKQYHKNIKILYVDELKNNSPYVIKMMKHSLGLPTSFLLNKDKVLIDVRRKISHPFGIEFEKSYDLNYDSFTSAISLLLINDSGQYTQAEKSLTP